MTSIDPMAIFSVLFMIVTGTFIIKQNTLGLTFCVIVVLILNIAVPMKASFIDGITVFTAFSILFPFSYISARSMKREVKRDLIKNMTRWG